jgi:hypothetical protein
MFSHVLHVPLGTPCTSLKLVSALQSVSCVTLDSESMPGTTANVFLINDFARARIFICHLKKKAENRSMYLMRGGDANDTYEAML